MDQPSEMKKHDDEKIEKYHVEDAFRHLVEAEKVKNNPKLLAAVKKHAEEHGAAIDHIKGLGEPKAKSVADLKKLRHKMSHPKED